MMRITPSARFTLAAFAALLIAACDGRTSDEARPQPAALVDTNSPPLLGVSIGDLGPLPVRGRFLQVDAKGKTIPYVGQVSRGDDLTAPPSTDREPWVLAAGTPGIVPGATIPTLTDALEAADADNAGVEAGALESLFELLSFLHIAPDATHASATLFQGYTPLRARWQSAQYVGGGVFRGIPLLGHFDRYPAPAAVAEFRERGARLYCAARELGFENGSEVRSMGEQVGFSVKILGKRIDFLVVEPTLTMNGPKLFGRERGRFAQPNGVQSFEIPFGFGTRITPIRGIGLPGLREIRYPVELVTADTEGLTPAKLAVRADRTIGFEKQYITAEHADAIQSAWETMSAGITVPLFEAGLLHVDLIVTLDADIGRPIVPGAVLPTGLSAQPYDRVVVASTMLPLIFPTTRPSWSPVPDFTSGRTVTYHDGAWGRNDCIVGEFHPCPSWDWAVRPSETSPFWQASTAALGAFNTRLYQDDDHVYRTRTSLGLTGKVRGTLGFDRVGPFRVSLSVEGGINGTVGQSHVLRDAVIGELAPGDASTRAASAVTVRPRTDASASLTDTFADLHFSFHVPFYGDISWDPRLLHADPVTLASWDTDDAHTAWKEESTLRIGTGANAGDVTKQPDVFSHLPKKADRPTFTSSIDACLADTRDNPLPPKPCLPEPPTGAPPRSNTCMFVTGQLPPDVCSNIPAAAALAGGTASQTACLTDYYAFLCRPVSNQAGGALSHIVDIGDEQTMSQLGTIMNGCIAAYVPTTAPDPAAAAHAFVDSFFRMSLCDDGAALIAGSDLFGPWSSAPPTEAPETTVPATECK